MTALHLERVGQDQLKKKSAHRPPSLLPSDQSCLLLHHNNRDHLPLQVLQVLQVEVLQKRLKWGIEIVDLALTEAKKVGILKLNFIDNSHLRCHYQFEMTTTVE
jgi:hypothetical protein